MHIGVLGGGQLGRMLAEAGMPLGMHFTFLDPNPDACAGSHGRLLVAPWEDPAALAELARCDRVTFDFENVPAATLDALSGQTTVRPPATALAAGQDRLHEKRLFRELGLTPPQFHPVSSRAELAAAVDAVGLPAVLKTRRMGYDGKGQAVLRQREDLELAWQRLGEHELILEAWVDFSLECAISAVRGADGEVRCYPLTRTWHADGVLRLALAPLPGAGELQGRAEAMITRLLEALDYTGLLSLELFLADGELLVNEFAPRVHNSAHWSIEGAWCSQFENHLRAVAGLPLGDTSARGASLMVNWIGQLPPARDFLDIPGLYWHDYAKAARAGRKVGHATLLADDLDSLRQAARTLAPRLPSAMAEPMQALFDE